MNSPKEPNRVPRYGPRTPLVAMSLLRVLFANEGGLTAQALAKRAGQALPSVYRHLDTLIHMGVVYKTSEEGRFRINPAARLLDDSADHEAIDVLLKAFVKETGHEIALATLHDGQLALTHLHTRDEGVSLLAGVPPYALHATAVGKALLSALPSAERRRLLAEAGMPAFTPKTITSPDAFEAQLRSDKDGIWSANGEFCDDGACLAVLADTGRFWSDCIAVTTSVRICELERERDQIVAALHRVVVLLKPALGPLLPLPE